MIEPYYSKDWKAYKMTPEESLLLVIIGGIIMLAGFGQVFKFLYENGVVK